MSTITEEALRKMLKSFNEDLGVYINNDQRYRLGRVLTIIDASIADPEQRKAIKDLVNNEWWSGGSRLSEGPMVNPHDDLRAICKALGFELYVETDLAPRSLNDTTEYATKRYQKIAKNEE